MVSWISRLAATAPMGTVALLIALAMVRRSGFTSKYCEAKGAPRRPKPVMTSSKISRMSCFVQSSRRRWR